MSNSKPWFEVYRSLAYGRLEYRWRLKVPNGDKIADSGEGYINKGDCLNGIRIVQESLNYKIYEI